MNRLGLTCGGITSGMFIFYPPAMEATAVRFALLQTLCSSPYVCRIVCNEHSEECTAHYVIVNPSHFWEGVRTQCIAQNVQLSSQVNIRQALSNLQVRIHNHAILHQSSMVSSSAQCIVMPRFLWNEDLTALAHYVSSPSQTLSEGKRYEFSVSGYLHGYTVYDSMYLVQSRNASVVIPITPVTSDARAFGELFDACLTSPCPFEEEINLASCLQSIGWAISLGGGADARWVLSVAQLKFIETHLRTISNE